MGELVDEVLEEFLSAGDSLYRLHSQRDSILHFDREGRHQADIATFFRFEYRLAHDYWYMQGRYYGIFQNDEEGFLVVSRDDLGNHDILPIAFPPASGHVPNIRHLGYGLIELHRRQSRSDTRLKRFGFLDYGTRSITWTEAYRAHFEHGKPVFRTACESFCE